jgi:hypothetical protein
MDNRIRYAWGQSYAGKFLAAMAAGELVTFGFPADEETAVEELRRRFPNATVEEDVTGLADTIADLARFLLRFKPNAAKG